MIKPLQVLKELDFERIAGSKGEEKAHKIICEHLDKAGIKYELEPFKLWAFDDGEASIEVENKTIPAMPMGLSDTIVLEGELCYLRNQNELLQKKGMFEGKIVLVNNVVRNVLVAMKEEKVAGFIRISAPNHAETSLSHRQQSRIDGFTPGVTITYDNAEKLLKFVGKKIKVSIKQNTEERTAYNIVATIGKPILDHNLSYMVAHYDSVARSHGSTDNAGGSVSILAAAERLNKLNLKRELKVCFFSGEELGLLGSTAYVETHKEEIEKRAGFVLNVDVAGDIFGTDSMPVLGTNNLMGYVSGIMMEEGHYFSERLDIYSSDGIPFSVYEVPSVSIARFGGKGVSNIHTKDDVAKYCTAEGLEFYAHSAYVIMKRILESAIYPVKKEIDSSLRDRLEKYLWNSRLVKPELQWTPGYKK
ncbi:MAG: M20/M25/M40 family metallo-hydrolase [Candidatus Cloacimonetes bacterium]|nr:M20/M25/M40 family metallo-hydrolase [Candidatus Cloacimonadota bacterium]